MKTGRPRRMTHKRVGSYYNKLTKSLTDSFYQKIIELENEVQLSLHPSMDTIKELGILYKKAIEAFSGVSSLKVQFYTNKLTKLLVAANKLTKKQSKKQTKWSQYMESHKKNTNKFMLFLQVEISKKDVNDIIDKEEKSFTDMNNYSSDEEENENEKYLDIEMVGTIGYIASEIILGMDKYTNAVDFYALGAISYELIFGYKPYNDLTR